jgi:hypothetical protein
MAKQSSQSTRETSPCGVRPDIPTNPFWHMSRAQTGSVESYRLLQRSIDWLSCQGRRAQPFDDDSKEFMNDLFEAFAIGGRLNGWPEAAQLSEHYVNGNGVPVTLIPWAYRSSVIVRDTSTAMKNYLRSSWTNRERPSSLTSRSRGFLASTHAAPLLRGRNQSSHGALLADGALLTEQNADNRFILESRTSSGWFGSVNTVWQVRSRYDFEPFAVRHVTDIPLGGNILRVPDGLSEYLTHTRIGVARVFDYSTQWSETWRP